MYSDIKVELKEELTEELKHIFTIMTNAEEADAVAHIKQIVDEHGLIPYHEFYQSKYNDHVVYDYEPFFMESFKYIIEFDMDVERNKHAIGFVTYLLKEWVRVVNKFNKLVELTE